LELLAHDADRLILNLQTRENFVDREAHLNRFHRHATEAKR
jgi:hypothetical protein